MWVQGLYWSCRCLLQILIHFFLVNQFFGIEDIPIKDMEQADTIVSDVACFDSIVSLVWEELSKHSLK